MSFGSIMTNNTASIALQALRTTTAELDMTQKRVATGLRVSDSRDDTGAFSVAQRVRADIGGLNSANDQLNIAKSVVGAGLTALERISQAITEVDTVLKELGSSFTTATERTAATERYNSLRNEIASLVNNSGFEGRSVLGTSAIGTSATAATAGAQFNVGRNENTGTITVAGTPVLPASTTGAVTTPAASVFDLRDAASTTPALWEEYRTGVNADGAASTSRTFNQVRQAVENALTRYSTANMSITNQIENNNKRMATLEAGVGAMVDADLTKESARLQSLQIRQQLGATALSTANAAPQFLASLFR